jgi:uncharacterized protein
MPHPTALRRRSFIQALGVLGSAQAAQTPPAATNTKVIDCHAHLAHHSRPAWSEEDRKVIDTADKLGIHELCCSILTPRRPSSPDEFRECNKWAAEAMGRFPGRVRGYCYVNPGYVRESLDEVRRCVEDRGFVGVKLYNEYRADEPVLFPLVELTIKLRVPILQHAGHPHYVLDGQPRLSDGGHIAELSRRYPEALLICGHVCGGGDWEWTIKSLRNAQGVFLDTSGTVVDEGVIEMAHRTLGADRLLFGCDNVMAQGIGKLRGADLPPADKQKIMGVNMAKIIGKRGAR